MHITALPLLASSQRSQILDKIKHTFFFIIFIIFIFFLNQKHANPSSFLSLLKKVTNTRSVQNEKKFLVKIKEAILIINVNKRKAKSWAKSAQSHGAGAP